MELMKRHLYSHAKTPCMTNKLLDIKHLKHINMLVKE